VGVLNTSEDTTAVIDIHIYDINGVRAGGIIGLHVPPGIFFQDNIFEVAFLANEDMDGSIEIKVRSGGPLAAYASVIDNRTQDPILIPAVEVAGVTAQ